MSEPQGEQRTIPVARYAFAVKEGATGEPRIVLDLKAAPDLEVLGDGRLGLELARPEIACARLLASRLNAAVRRVGDPPLDGPSPAPGAAARTQRAEYAVRATSGVAAGDQWVAAWPVEDGLAVLRGGSVGLLLQPEATGDDAAELAWDLEAAVAALTYCDPWSRSR